MGAEVGHSAPVHDRDAIRQVQGGTAVGHEQCRAPLHDLAQRGVDPLFYPGVDRARGVVEDQDARVGQDRPGERDALALAA
jgi:hypothetical protein